jgi:hydrogenase nickel incorporation protein HypA/HybF
MHELSIALSIIEIAEEQLARHRGRRIHAIHLRLGSSAGVVREALDFSFGLACEGTSAAGSQLIVEDIEGTDLDIVRMEIE